MINTNYAFQTKQVNFGSKSIFEKIKSVTQKTEDESTFSKDEALLGLYTACYKYSSGKPNIMNSFNVYSIASGIGKNIEKNQENMRKLADTLDGLTGSGLVRVANNVQDNLQRREYVLTSKGIREAEKLINQLNKNNRCSCR